MNREKLSQLVQDVIEGRESPQKAWSILNRYAAFIDDCLDEVGKYIKHGNSKDNDKPGTF